MAVFTALCVAMLLSFQAIGQTSEYRLKAAFIYNFLPYIEWPAEDFPAANSPLIIGIMGTDPFGKEIDDTFRDKRINNRDVVIRRFKSADKIMPCHVLFVSRSERDRVDEVLRAVHGKSVFSISDIEGFAQAGGTLQFFLEGNKLRFEINPNAAKRARLQVSSKLLRLAKIVATNGS